MINELVQRFKIHLEEDGKSVKTVESYVGDTSAFVAFLEEKGVDFNGEMKRFYITSYRNYLIEQQYELSTINKKVNSIHSFNRYLMDSGCTKDIVVDIAKDRVKLAYGSERQVEILTDRQVERILFYMQNDEKVSRRNRMIILLLLYTGLRVSELCDIKAKNIDFLTAQLRVFGKGGKVREVPLKSEVVDAIKEYLVERSTNPFADSEYLIVGQRGVLQRDAINTMLEKLVVRSGIDVRLKPHTFRHTFCTRLVSKGVPLTTVSKLAGHSSIDTTARFYINCSKEEKMKAVNLL
ncbi:tyrosine-type recombinase/integrase [Clostridium beijerinckii]|uniref:tyrosine-type recombinase/integrase n=1 Tax=Clostridium beijerinckii TaxID=1520 RepID=UPI0009CD715E|nr:tyrosine-type recombinase/integrase [Clostridium beijerinckii]NRT79268.1 integrase/recombinase XerD [Clostridium beijerinckii]OOM43830.1 tyrosine recombinase XerC [Clostridium beijerinckii]